MLPNYPIGDSNLVRTWDNQLQNIALNPETQLIDNGFTPNTPAKAQLINYALNILGMKVNQNLLYGLPQWNENTIYVIGSGVQYEGKWYRCIAPNASKRPDLFVGEFWDDFAAELNTQIESPDDSLTIVHTAGEFAITVTFNADGIPATVFNPNSNYQVLTNNSPVDVSALRKGATYVVEAVNDITLSFSNGTYRGGSALSTATTQFINAGETLSLLKATDNTIVRVA